MYRETRCPQGRPRELMIDLQRDEVIDLEYAAAMVGTSVSLAEGRIVRIIT
jgi:hypothetical protein